MYSVSRTKDYLQEMEEVPKEDIKFGCVLFAKCFALIAEQDAIRMLSQENKINVSTHPPDKPSGGEVYMYEIQNGCKDWVVDGYQWVNMATYKYKDSLVRRTKYKVRGVGGVSSCEFQRHSFTLVNNGKYTLVQYLGNKSVFVPKSHGNCKSNDAPYVRTLPSVKKALIEGRLGHKKSNAESSVSKKIGKFAKVIRVEAIHKAKRTTRTATPKMEIQTTEQNAAEHEVEDITKSEPLMSSTLYAECGQILPPTAAFQLLHEKNTKKASTIPPYRPSKNEVYLLKTSNDQIDWMMDGYKWANSVEYTDSGVVRTTSLILGGDPTTWFGFKRILFELCEDDGYSLVQYIDDTLTTGLSKGSRSQSIVTVNPDVDVVSKESDMMELVLSSNTTTLPDKSLIVKELKQETDEINNMFPVVFAISEQILPFEYAYRVLTRSAPVNVSLSPPYQPVGSHIYLYDAKAYKDVWMKDGYTWHENVTDVVHSTLFVHRHTSYLHAEQNRGVDSFQRVSYQLLGKETSDYILVQYIGDDRLARTKRSNANPEDLLEDTEEVSALIEVGESSLSDNYDDHTYQKSEQIISSSTGQENQQLKSFKIVHASKNSSDGELVTGLPAPEVIKISSDAPKIFAKSDSLLTPNYASEVLFSKDKINVSTRPVLYPTAGEIYLYDLKKHKSDDTWNWKKDGYKWKNQGTKVFEEECISRTHFYIIPSSDSKPLLKRVAFTTLKPCGFLLVQYLRKECYSNTKKSTDLSTNPNTLAAMKSCHVVLPRLPSVSNEDDPSYDPVGDSDSAIDTENLSAAENVGLSKIHKEELVEKLPRLPSVSEEDDPSYDPVGDSDSDSAIDTENLCAAENVGLSKIHTEELVEKNEPGQATIYGKRETQLEASEVGHCVSYALFSANKGRISSCAPTHPSHGEMYLYDLNTIKESCRQDGYTWINKGNHWITDNIHYTLYSMRGSGDISIILKKFVYQVANASRYVLVHYLLDKRRMEQKLSLPETMSCKIIYQRKTEKAISLLPKKVAARKTPVKAVTLDVYSSDSDIAMSDGEPEVTEVPYLYQKHEPNTAKVFATCGSPLRSAYIANLLLERVKVNVSTAPATDPSPGEIYLYNLDKVVGNWRIDGYEWIHDESKVMDLDIQVEQWTRKSDELDTSLKRLAYSTLTKACGFLLVHYLHPASRGSTSTPKSTWKKTRKTPSKKRLFADVESLNESMEMGNIELMAPAEEEPSMPKAKLFAKSDEKLTTGYAAKILSSTDNPNISNVPPFHPSGGEIYLYEKKLNNGNIWLMDGYRWTKRGVGKPNPQHGVKVDNYFINGKNDYFDGFRRLVFCFAVNPDLVIVQYIGDKHLYIPVPRSGYVSPTEQSNLDWFMKVQPPDECKELPQPADWEDHSTLLFGTCNSTLSVDYVEKLLQRDPQINVSKLPPYQPKNGEMYLYDIRVNKKDWVADGYKWTNKGYNRYDRKSHFIDKNRFHINGKYKCSTGFQRICYKLRTDNGPGDYALVQYLGDPSLYVPEKHGNSRSEEPYTTLMPSMRAAQAAKRKAKSSALARQRRKVEGVMNREVKREINQEIPDGVMEMTQPQIVKRTTIPVPKFEKLNVNNMITAYSMNHDLGTFFVFHLALLPQFFAVAACPKIVKLTNAVLVKTLHVPVVFSLYTKATKYFYVTVLLCYHHLFSVDKQPIAVACILHERKLANIANDVVEQFGKLLPQLTKSRCAFVLNHDNTQLPDGILEKHFPTISVVYCWNYLMEWFCADENRNYRTDLEQILSKDAHWEFLLKYENLRKLWSPEKIKHFDQFVKPKVERIGRWHLKELNLCHADHGVVKLNHVSWQQTMNTLIEQKMVLPHNILREFFQFQMSAKVSFPQASPSKHQARTTPTEVNVSGSGEADEAMDADQLVHGTVLVATDLTDETVLQQSDVNEESICAAKHLLTMATEHIQDTGVVALETNCGAEHGADVGVTPEQNIDQNGTVAMAVEQDIDQTGIATGQIIDQTAVVTGQDLDQNGIATGQIIDQTAVVTGQDLDQNGMATGQDIDQNAVGTGQDIDQIEQMEYITIPVTNASATTTFATEYVIINEAGESMMAEIAH